MAAAGVSPARDAGTPGSERVRAEESPGRGVDELGDDGGVGGEYGPKTKPLEGLSWARRFGLGSTE